MRMRIEFLRADPQSNEPRPATYQEVISHAASLPEDGTVRLRKYQDTYVRLLACRRSKNRLIGDLTRIKTSDYPVLQDLHSSDHEPLELRDDQGLGTQCAFVFDIRTQVLALEVRQMGANSNVFASYFSRLYPDPVNYLLLPVVTTEGLDVLAGTKRAKSLRISMASVENPNLSKRPSTKELSSLLRFFDAPTLKVEVTGGRRRTGLPASPIRRIVEALLAAQAADEVDLTTLKASVIGDEGSAGTDEVVTVDFLTNRLIEYAEPEPDLARGGVSRQRRQAEVNRALDKHAARLQEIYA